MGLDRAATQELVRRSAAEARAVDRIACGAGTDQLDPALVARWTPATRARSPR